LKEKEVEIYDISQVLREGIAVWPGDPEFRRRRVLKIASGASANVSSIDMGVHTGTHIDAPLHLSDCGSDIARLALHYFLGPARVISLCVRECIRSADLSGLDWRGVERVLFKTRPDTEPGDAFDPLFISIGEDAAEFLARQGMLLVGIDAPSVDAAGSAGMPAHHALLEHGTMILEGIRLEGVQPGDYELVCLPLRLEGCDGSPVRAILCR
jgi:arylformamidase